ncbi:MAG TPA: choice-of-anchor tandem repeat GloVer-containing protein [Candidatus Sulfotelmatobacter sp.]|nr:choice-of-anchor tandem repeat GloVer-containing protein [Candidatus Sulfotelmatobacter sp.]
MKPKWDGALRLALVGIFVITFAAAPLQAQFTYWDRYDFTCDAGLGCAPNDLAQLAQGLDGNLYGTTYAGGTHAFGTIFMVTPLGAYTDLWEFDGVSGENPLGGLTLASDGNFYGTATFGGAFNCGTVFRFTPPSTLTVLHSFNCSSDGQFPAVPPIQGADGNLYGVANSGTVYSIALATGIFTPLSQAPPTIYAPLYLASDGNLYGTSAYGGDFNSGTVFRVSTPGGAIKVLHSFTGSDGYNPDSPVVQGSDGYLYGTTLSTTFSDPPGVIYKMSLSGKLVVVHDFGQFTSTWTNPDGAFPQAGLVAASDGNFYGVTGAGGANGYGTIYQFKSATNFTKLFDLNGSANAILGGTTNTGLIQHTNGSLFGVTSELGAYAEGNLYNLTAVNFSQILTVAGPIFVLPGGPVQILGNSLTQVSNINFGAVPATFRIGSDSQLLATVPFAAVDAAISATYVTGLQVGTVSSVHILPLITTIDPLSGPVGTVVTISGGGFNGATKVSFAGVDATSYSVVSPSTIQATVPSGFIKGRVAVKTRNGKATSTQKFLVQ